LVQKSSGIKVHNALALPILQYVSEIWALRQRIKKLLTSLEREVSEQRVSHFLAPKRMKKIFGRVESANG
jgi:hypothetical protein